MASLTPKPPRRPSSAARSDVAGAMTAPRKASRSSPTQQQQQPAGSARYLALKQAAADERDMLMVAFTEAKSAMASDLSVVDISFSTPGFVQQTRRRRLASPTSVSSGSKPQPTARALLRSAGMYQTPNPPRNAGGNRRGSSIVTHQQQQSMPKLEITVESLLQELRQRKMAEQALLDAATTTKAAPAAASNSSSTPTTPSNAATAAARRQSQSHGGTATTRRGTAVSAANIAAVVQSASNEALSTPLLLLRPTSPSSTMDLITVTAASPPAPTRASSLSPPPTPPPFAVPAGVGPAQQRASSQRSPAPGLRVHHAPSGDGGSGGGGASGAKRDVSPLLPGANNALEISTFGVSPSPFLTSGEAAGSRPSSRLSPQPRQGGRRRSTVASAAASRGATPLIPGADASTSQRPLRFGRSKSLASGRELLSEAKLKYKQLLLDAKRTNAATVLQRWFRRNQLRWQERRLLRAQKGIATVFSRCILRFVCKVRAKRTARLAREAALAQLTSRQRECTLVIQRALRRYLAKRVAHAMREARDRAQRYRRWQERRRYAVLCLVRWFRSRKLARAIAAARAANAAEKHAAFMQRAALNVLVTQGRRVNRANANRHHTAAIILQSAYRGHRVRLRVRAWRSLLRQQLPPVVGRGGVIAAPLAQWLRTELVATGRRW